MIGETVSHYRIVSMLGKGGMGVVYQAEDTRLGRSVALKFLPEESVPGDILMERFRREAKLASALNHPNICTIYDIGEVQGRPFIAMELLDGTTLQRLIRNNPLEFQVWLDLATQLADALDAAHQAGIIHRDIKSSNIMVTERELAKILDFGLAKPVSRVSPFSQDATSSAHETADQLTNIGMAVGTISYMSPEQARGDELDGRSDLYSLGIVLYEMATGVLPFRGKTTAMVFNAILNEAPESPLNLNSDLPQELVWIIQKLLEKDKSVRYQHAADLRADLLRLKRDSSSTKTDTLPLHLETREFVQSADHASPSPVRKWGLYSGGLMFVALLMAVTYWMWPNKEEASVQWAELAANSRLRQLISGPGMAYDPALSPDGKTLAWIGEDESQQVDLYVRRVAGGQPVRLTDNEDVESRPCFSPDGEQLAFTNRKSGSGISEICLVATLGSSTVSVLVNASNPVWSPDGKRLAFLTESGSGMSLATANADGSDRQVLLNHNAGLPFFRDITWSPDGSAIAVVRSSGGVAGQIWSVPLSGDSPQQLWEDPAGVFSQGLQYTADGQGIVHSSNRNGATNLWFLPLAADGTPVPLTTGAGHDVSPTIATDGTIAFVNRHWKYELISFDLESLQVDTILDHTHYIWSPVFSPNGQEVAYSRSEMDGAWHIWTVPTSGGRTKQMTFSDHGEVYPDYSPDNKFLTYMSWSEPRQVWQLPRSGGPPTKLTPPNTLNGRLSPDGNQLAYAQTESDSEKIWILSLEDGHTRRLTDSPGSVPTWSPDGTWIAFSPNRGYYGGVFVIRADGSDERRLTETGGWPTWWPDGEHLGYLSVGPDRTQQVYKVSVDGGEPTLLEGLNFNGTNCPFDISPDGKKLVTSNWVRVSDQIWLLERNQDP